MSDQVPVTDADREALLTHCDSLLNGIPYNGRGYAESRESARRKTRRLLEKAIARARAEGAASEYERILAALKLVEFDSYGHRLEVEAAIRARSEGGKA